MRILPHINSKTGTPEVRAKQRLFNPRSMSLEFAVGLLALFTPALLNQNPDSILIDSLKTLETLHEEPFTRQNLLNGLSEMSKTFEQSARSHIQAELNQLERTENKEKFLDQLKLAASRSNIFNRALKIFMVNKFGDSILGSTLILDKELAFVTDLLKDQNQRRIFDYWCSQIENLNIATITNKNYSIEGCPLKRILYPENQPTSNGLKRLIAEVIVGPRFATETGRKELEALVKAQSNITIFVSPYAKPLSGINPAVAVQATYTNPLISNSHNIFVSLPISFGKEDLGYLTHEVSHLVMRETNYAKSTKAQGKWDETLKWAGYHLKARFPQATKEEDLLVRKDELPSEYKFFYALHGDPNHRNELFAERINVALEDRYAVMMQTFFFEPENFIRYFGRRIYDFVRSEYGLDPLAVTKNDLSAESFITKIRESLENPTTNKSRPPESIPLERSRGPSQNNNRPQPQYPSLPEDSPRKTLAKLHGPGKKKKIVNHPGSKKSKPKSDPFNSGHTAGKKPIRHDRVIRHS